MPALRPPDPCAPPPPLPQPPAVHRGRPGAIAGAQGQVCPAAPPPSPPTAFFWPWLRSLAAKGWGCTLLKRPAPLAAPAGRTRLSTARLRWRCWAGAAWQSSACRFRAGAGRCAGAARSTDGSSAPACLAGSQDRGMGDGAAQQAHAELSISRPGCCQESLACLWHWALPHRGPQRGLAAGLPLPVHEAGPGAGSLTRCI